MRRIRFRWDMRTVTLAVAAFAIAVAVLVVWLGHRADRFVDRLAAEGRLVQGRYLSRSYGSCTDDGCDSDEIHVGYEVDGVAYRTSMFVTRSNRSGPIFEDEVIRVPRLGPERPYQVVYLPADPSRARLRADLSRNDVAIYGTAGMFLLCGLVFGAAGLFLLKEPRGLSH